MLSLTLPVLLLSACLQPLAEPAAAQQKQYGDVSAGRPTDPDALKPAAPPAEAAKPVDPTAWPKVEQAVAKRPRPAQPQDILGKIGSDLQRYPGPPEPVKKKNPVAIILDATGSSKAAEDVEYGPGEAISDLKNEPHKPRPDPNDHYRELRAAEAERADLAKLVRETMARFMRDDEAAMEAVRQELRSFAKQNLQSRTLMDISEIRERVSARQAAFQHAATCRQLAALKKPAPEKAEPLYRLARDSATMPFFPADYKAYFAAIRDAARPLVAKP